MSPGHESFDDRPEPTEAEEEKYRKRFNDYAVSIFRIERAFKETRVQRFSGPPGDSLRRQAVTALVRLQEAIGGDRIPITDRLAVVPNYYGTYKVKDKEALNDAEVVKSVHDSLIRIPAQVEPAGVMAYVVGFELVIRDFRNYEALYEPLAQDNMRYLRHPCGSPFPPVEPNGRARVFDIPVGYIRAFNFYPPTHTLSMTIIGQYRETIHLEIEVPYKDTPKRRIMPEPERVDMGMFIDDIGIRWVIYETLLTGK